MYLKLGYLMRSGPPDTLDRMVARAFGHLAFQLIHQGEFGLMVALREGKYTSVPLEFVISGKKVVNVKAYYDLENYKPKIKSFLGVPMFLE